MSDSVHSKVRDLERYLVLDEAGNIKSFRWGPDDSEIKEILLAVVEFMLVCLKCTLSYFEQPQDQILTDFHEQLKALADSSEKPQ
jgi:hypothetical protein